MIDKLEELLLYVEFILDRSWMKSTNNYIEIWHAAMDLKMDLISIIEELKNDK